ncbi:hypothetical protein CMEL01_05475 [Colletotrichum melonis]|uniref:Uncharacterized protein n=1 Tax=Colletotrichum melonis TaxID=1209925 RepID=A0AAI9UC94_9PEZI|nr:hypothetical protein CMEL01_05475 [Colletotrichum melonis]
MFRIVVFTQCGIPALNAHGLTFILLCLTQLLGAVNTTHKSSVRWDILGGFTRSDGSGSPQNKVLSRCDLSIIQS